ncbi:hypothetical protein D3C76_1073990 [compost metagenome]
MGLGHGVRQHLGGAGVVLERKQRIGAAGARAPEAVAALVDEGGDVVLVEVVGVGGRVLQVPEDVGGDAGHAVDRDVGEGLVPADLLIELRAQAQGHGNGRRRPGGVGGGVPALEVRPDHHDLASAEALDVGDGLFLGLGAAGGHVGEGAQLLSDGDQGGGHGQGVEPGHAQDARHDAEPGLGAEQRLHAGVLAVGGDGADEVAVGGGLVGAFRDAHHDGGGVGLVGDGLQAGGQGAVDAGLADGGLHVGEQHRSVEGEGRSVGVFGGSDQPDDGGGDGSDGAAALAEFEDPHAVMVVGHGLCLRSG